MQYEFQSLNEKEKELMMDAPVLVSILVADADNDHSEDEKKEAIRLAHIKTFSERQELHPYYHHLDKEFSERYDTLMNELPGGIEERREEIIQRLEKLNQVFKKLNQKFASYFYMSLKDFAFYVATATGGLLGIGSIRRNEKQLLELPMIEPPVVS